MVRQSLGRTGSSMILYWCLFYKSKSKADDISFWQLMYVSLFLILWINIRLSLQEFEFEGKSKEDSG